MSNVESRAPRRGLWLMLTAWVVVLGLVGAAVGFVMLERYDKAGEGQVTTAEGSADMVGEDSEAAKASQGSPAEASGPDGSVGMEAAPATEHEAPKTASEETDQVPANEAASETPEQAVALEPESEETGTEEEAAQADVAHEEPETNGPEPEQAAHDELAAQAAVTPDVPEIAHQDGETAPSAETSSEGPADQQASDHGTEETTADAHGEAATGETPEAADAAGETQEAADAAGETQEAADAAGETQEAADAAGETQEAADAAGETQVAAVDDDGIPPWQRYAGQARGDAGGPKIAVVLTGLGLSAAATEAAIKQLPSEVTLSFSPYARRLNQWIALARVNGHEVMIDLPMEPVTFPEDDPGPHALLTFLDSKQNLRRLDWVLNRGNSFVGVAAVMGSRFVASEEDMGPVMAALMERGLMFLDNRASDRSVAGDIAGRLGMPHAVNDRTLDAAQASRIAINSRLTEIERLAQEKGQSIAMAQPYPVTLERLRDWAVEIESRGYALVPITALAAKNAGG